MVILILLGYGGREMKEEVRGEEKSAVKSRQTGSVSFTVGVLGMQLSQQKCMFLYKESILWPQALQTEKCQVILTQDVPAVSDKLTNLE